MITVEPRYWIFGDPSDTGEMINFLTKNKLKWRPDPKVSWLENLHEFAGRLCYESWETEEEGFQNLNIKKIREGNDVYIKNILASGHHSVIEHGGPLVILFENVSRVFCMELIRHRLNSYSQNSGRYIRTDQLKFWTPDEIKQNTEAFNIFTNTLNYIEDAQHKLEELFDINNIKDFHTKKILTSAFRRISPNGQGNNILVSCNHRSMRHMIHMRTSEGAEVEMQIIFRKLAKDMKNRFPNLYQDMYETENYEWKFENPL